MAGGDFTSPYDATVVKLLKNAGVDIIGKANCDEFGMGSLNIHSVHGPVINPFQPTTIPGSGNVRRSAGGSSGGSAAAVAAGMCYAALGTDTGGSIRIPASYCGVVGLKPSYGLISRWGVVSYADSLDCVGILATDVTSVQNVFRVLSVYDDKDPTAATEAIRKQAHEAAQELLTRWAGRSDLCGLRIGIPQEYFPSELSSDIIEATRQTITLLKENGATVVPVSLPSTSYALSAYYVLASAEASSNLARYDGVEYGLNIKASPGTNLFKTSDVYAQSRSLGFGKEVQKRILLGTYALTADAFDNYFLQAQRTRQLIKNDFNSVFATPDLYSESSGASKDGVDVLLHPSAIRTAPPLSERTEGKSTAEEEDSLSAYVQDVLTVPASLAGLPALSVPAVQNSKKDGWPVGISIVGQWGCDEIVMRVGEIVEKLSREGGA
ncbi:hypothetical protein AX16_008124 [Volvariella volvacea WC 439]|nr:hypothetical protein AX16_008124 [Volvariella volvacea WC 439]